MFPVGPVPRLIIYSHMALAVLVTACSHEWHFTGVNVALQKQTEQGPGMYLDHESKRAVDNDTNPDPLAGNCAQTESSFNPYWSVYLGDMYVLKGIRLYSRDGNKEAIGTKVHFDYSEYPEELNLHKRLKNFQVIGFPNLTVLHDDKDAVPMLYAKSVIDIPVDSDVPFSNITVQIATHETKTHLALCEVQVFSVENDCHGIQSDGKVIWNIRNGTGNVNNEKGLVSSGTVIDFACQLNYQLIGRESIVCLTSGSYDNGIPTCKDMKEPEEISSSALVAIAGATVGAFGIGVAVGLLAALFIWKSRTMGRQTHQQTTSDTTYAAPIPGGMDDTYTELRAPSDRPDYMNV